VRNSKSTEEKIAPAQTEDVGVKDVAAGKGERGEALWTRHQPACVESEGEDLSE